MLGETYKNAVNISLGSAVYAYKAFGTTFTITDGEYLQIEHEKEDEKEMFKVDTVEQYKILQFIKKNFDMNYVSLELIGKNEIKVTDKNNDSLNFSWDSCLKKVIWQGGE